MTTTQTQSTLTDEQRTQQAKILESDSGKNAYFFAHHIPGADIPALQARVLEVGDGFDAYFFAKDIPGADIAALYARAEVLKFAGLEHFKSYVQSFQDASLASVEPTPTF